VTPVGADTSSATATRTRTTPVVISGLFFFGLGMGGGEITMNLEGADIEKVLPRPVLPHLHSLGFPLALSAAGEHDHDPARRVAFAATIGYAALVVGPPVIGFLGDHARLRRALIAPLVLVIGAVFLAPVVRTSNERQEHAASEQTTSKAASAGRTNPGGRIALLQAQSVALLACRTNTTALPPRQHGSRTEDTADRSATSAWLRVGNFHGGPYRARTDDIHGVNVALYQLS
jgi:hypothetical protein